MSVNNLGNRVDSSGAVAVDFVWGNFPMQPNDERGDSNSAIETTIQAADAAQDKSWGAVKKYQSGRLDFTKSIHAVAEAGYAGYPAFSGNGDGAYTDGTPYIVVPNVMRLSVASATDALKDAGYTTVTVGSAFTPVISAITLTSNIASVTATGHGYAVGDVVTIAGLTNGSGNASADADLNGTYTITATPDADNFRFAKTHTNISTHSGLTGNTAKVMAKANLVYNQSVAPGAGLQAAGGSITIRPYFAS
jgi:hypothetical protein